MTRAEANRLLDRVKAGEVNASAAAIAMALRATGDIGCRWPARPLKLLVFEPPPFEVVRSHLNRSTRVMRQRTKETA